MLILQLLIRMAIFCILSMVHLRIRTLAYFHSIFCKEKSEDYAE